MSLWFLVFYHINPQIACIYISKHGEICKSLRSQYRLKIMSLSPYYEDFLQYKNRKRSFSFYRLDIILQNIYDFITIACRFRFLF